MPGAPVTATAFAPATVGNVAAGFDVLGQAFPALGDRVQARRSGPPGVRIAAVTGVATDLPRGAAENTAGRAVQSFLAMLGLPIGIELSIDKGIPLGSGLGGSAASAVAAVVAANALLDRPLPPLALLPHAVEGEAAASGSRHADNVAPSLLGGLVLTLSVDPPLVCRIPVPAGVHCVLVHPRMFLATRDARARLRPEIPLALHAEQSALLAGLVAGCHAGDREIIRATLRDVVVEPQRAGLIPGFGAVQQAAMARGALGSSISGAGPSVFAWCDAVDAAAIGAAMVAEFGRAGLACDCWVAPVGGEGARVLERA